MHDGNPPSSYYDPPEPKHEPECNCHCDCDAGADEDGDPICNKRGPCGCHGWHIEEGLVVDNALSPQDFQCCVDQLEEWFSTFQRCRKHPKAYAEQCVDGNKKPIGIYCEACDDEDALKEKEGGN